jgi:hypothetical protein
VRSFLSRMLGLHAPALPHSLHHQITVLFSAIARRVPVASLSVKR